MSEKRAAIVARLDALGLDATIPFDDPGYIGGTLDDFPW